MWPKKSICDSPSLPTWAVRPQFWFWWLKLQKNEKTKFFKLPDWQWCKLLTSTPLTYVLENCLKYDISDGEHGNVHTFVSRGILVSKNSQKRQKSHFWWPRKLFLWLCPHHLRARANFFTTFIDSLDQPTFQRTTSKHLPNRCYSPSKTGHEKNHKNGREKSIFWGSAKSFGTIIDNQTDYYSSNFGGHCMFIACTSPKIVVFWPYLKSEFKN